MARLVIGMPVWNGAAFIRQAIESLRRQTFDDWRLVVSDNASSDGTADICREIAAEDVRIRLVRQDANIGAAANFREVLNRADGELFMWAATDDQWRPEFLRRCVRALDANPSIGMAFTGVENIDLDGNLVRSYPDLPKLTGPASLRTVAAYLLSREACGKANLIYSVYRSELCRKVLQLIGFPQCWGGDMAFVLGAIARGGISIDPEVLFQKRLNATEAAITTPYHRLPPRKGGIFPLEEFPEYKAGLLSAVSGTGFATLTSVVMDYRLYRAKLAQVLK